MNQLFKSFQWFKRLLRTCND